VWELVVCLFFLYYLHHISWEMSPPPPPHLTHTKHSSCWAFVCSWTHTRCCFCQGGLISASSQALFSLRTSLGASDHQHQTYLHLISMHIGILTLADSCVLFVSLEFETIKKFGLSSCGRNWKEGNLSNGTGSGFFF